MGNYSDLLVIQYAGKPRATATINLLSDQWAKSFSGVAQIPDMLDIDNARGVNLDIIGKIVGQDRMLPEAIEREFFAFLGDGMTKGFRRGGMSGSPWYRNGDAIAGSVSLSDSEMRILIKARCIKNFSRCNIDDVERSCELLFGSSGYDLDITAPCVWTITTYSVDSFILFSATSLDVLPRATGVRYDFIEA